MLVEFLPLHCFKSLVDTGIKFSGTRAFQLLVADTGVLELEAGVALAAETLSISVSASPDSFGRLFTMLELEGVC